MRKTFSLQPIEPMLDRAADSSAAAAETVCQLFRQAAEDHKEVSR